MEHPTSRRRPAGFPFAVALTVLWPLLVATSLGLLAYLRQVGVPMPRRIPTMIVLASLIFVCNVALVVTVLREHRRAQTA
jgi:hypothetical protein